MGVRIRRTFWFLCLLLFTPPAPVSWADTIIVSSVDGLMATSGPNQQGNRVVLITPGTYVLPGRIIIDGNRVTYRSQSGNRDSVVLKGQGIAGKVRNIFSITGSQVTIQSLTLGEVSNHGIQIHGENDSDHVFLQDLRFYDIGEQMLKGSFDRRKPLHHTDHGLVENCLFEFTEGYAGQSYTGGIDIHHGEHWVVTGNQFRNIRTRGRGLTEGAIHFWNNSRDVRIIGNTITNCDRGVMLGLDNAPHSRGTIEYNLIHTTADTGIYLCNASDIDVNHNKIFIDSSYPYAIEYRFKGSRNIEIRDNITNRRIVSRNGGRARLIKNTVDSKIDWSDKIDAETLEKRVWPPFPRH